MTHKLLTIILGIVLSLSFISFASAALIVENINQGKLYPGSEASLDVKIKNDFNYDVEDVKLTLIFNQLTSTGAVDFSKPVLFSSVGSSQDSQDSIDEDDSETFSFDIKASNSIEPGDYSLLYTIEYTNNNDTKVTETGSITLVVNSKTSLDFSVKQEMPVIDNKDKITFKIINKGFGEIKFVSVDLNEAGSNGLSLLSEDKVYIGSIASDDSDTASFDAILNKENPSVSFIVTYKDFENNDKTQTLSFDLKAYSREKAIQLGIVKKSNAPVIIGVVVLVVVVWLIVRAVRKARKRKANNLKRMNNSGMKEVRRV